MLPASRFATFADGDTCLQNDHRPKPRAAAPAGDGRSTPGRSGKITLQSVVSHRDRSIGFPYELFEPPKRRVRYAGAVVFCACVDRAVDEDSKRSCCGRQRPDRGGGARPHLNGPLQHRAPAQRATDHRRSTCKHACTPRRPPATVPAPRSHLAPSFSFQQSGWRGSSQAAVHRQPAPAVPDVNL